MNRSTNTAAPGGARSGADASLAVAALGVVYGDIGTSPIYALRECFHGANPVAPTPLDVLGVLSLVVWALIVTVTIKYLLFVMRNDNHGEGGIIALVALLNPWNAKRHSLRRTLMLLGLFGGALLYGDGTITPAISVLSAIEGLKVATNRFEPYVLPLTVAILFALFAVQKRGTGRIGRVFGPVIALWFASIAALGVRGIAMDWRVLAAFDPAYALRFFVAHGAGAYLVLGAVFLAVTGAEALYADMGQFGRRPIRIAWFALVLPALLLNYFGQGGLILATRGAARQPFYELAPPALLYPLVGLATAATIIASQAVISGAFSLTRQLVTLGQLPRVNIVQTSAEERGQIYIPSVNWVLMLLTIGLVLDFKTSDALASAYGIAVSATMVITTAIAYFVSRRLRWNPLLTAVMCLVFLGIDLAFFGANLYKIAEGGWYPISVAIGVF
ncbi:MAG TPA: KUP/HAK/KT family potassium transporter, partial [Steroidobacteraceae bacterium]|nr:KUP/HAK/KT family potassium transporter [Steroidobacteraceae bacterium]